MGDFIIITLMVSSFWLLWEIIRVVSMEWLNRDEITLPAGELGRSELLRCADSFEQLSGMFQGMVRRNFPGRIWMRCSFGCRRASAAAVRPQHSAGTMEVKRGSADSTGSQRALSRGKS